MDVEAPAQTRIERLMASRGMSKSDAQNRIAAQTTEKQRRAAATYVIDASGTLDETIAQADNVFDLLQRG